MLFLRPSHKLISELDVFHMLCKILYETFLGKVLKLFGKDVKSNSMILCTFVIIVFREIAIIFPTSHFGVIIIRNIIVYVYQILLLSHTHISSDMCKLRM
jgi:hypothetical protein